MSTLDVLRTEGLSPPNPVDPDTPASTPAVLNAQIGPYIEDLLRWNRHMFGSQRQTKEVLATVRSPVLPDPSSTRTYAPPVLVTLARTRQGGSCLQAAWPYRLLGFRT